MSTIGFHEGELTVQRKAGVSHDAARLEGMLRPALLEGGAKKFLAQREFAAITARDAEGRMWTTALTGQPGFLDAAGTTLTAQTAPGTGAALHLSGTATLQWDAPGETGRAVRFHPTRAVLNSWA